jgi:ectoine hydroxylase-related dioxygenase (phytanoyl-CoA dioxygenase family)
MTVENATIVPRAITDEERAFFDRNGWVKLEQLIAEEQAVALRSRFELVMGADAKRTNGMRSNGAEDHWRTYSPVSIENATGKPIDDVFYAFSHSREFGAVGSALLGGPVRYWLDQSMVKMPAGAEGSKATYWHKDTGDASRSPFAPARQVQFWIALVDVTPALGAMRFIAPKDETDEVHAIIKDAEVADTYAELERLGVLSPAHSLRPGDATVHSGNTLHSAPPNTTDSMRWAYLASVFPADSTWTGKSFWPTTGVEGLVEGEVFPDHRYPVLQ